MSDKALRYYKKVEDYHRLAEESHANEMFSPDLLLRFIDRSSHVLDVAGGTGFNAEMLNIPASSYVCLDISERGLRLAREKGRGAVIQADAGTIPIRDNSVDAVLCSWSFEHFSNPGCVLEEMVRVVRPYGSILIWSPNWDNIFRKDFPQFAHKSRAFVAKVRWKIFLKMLKNEFVHFRYAPFTSEDVAAFVHPDRFISNDTDAVHCVLCQETVKFFQSKRMNILHISDFSEMTSHVRNSPFIRMSRAFLKPWLPILRHTLLLRWFVMRFPIIVEKGAVGK
jgi:ubiquinone/menaquinone biosynthesis C-methylase UbiE